MSRQTPVEDFLTPDTAPTAPEVGQFIEFCCDYFLSQYAKACRERHVKFKSEAERELLDALVGDTSAKEAIRKVIDAGISIGSPWEKDIEESSMTFECDTPYRPEPEEGEDNEYNLYYDINIYQECG